MASWMMRVMFYMRLTTSTKRPTLKKAYFATAAVSMNKKDTSGATFNAPVVAGTLCTKEIINVHNKIDVHGLSDIQALAYAHAFSIIKAPIKSNNTASDNVTRDNNNTNTGVVNHHVQVSPSFNVEPTKDSTVVDAHIVSKE